MKTPLEILTNYWKHSTFRSPQLEIINNVLQKNDVIALLPTGAGKSVCYQIPALLNDGFCIVISPLIALIEDQVKSLQKKGIKAIALTSKLNQDETVIAFDNLQHGNYKFLYLSPEKLQSQLIQEKIKNASVNLIAVDEAHCISEWGHDFRPAYLKINLLKQLQPNVPFIALTATATATVLNDITTKLELNNAIVYKKSFFRSSLSYHVYKTNDKFFKLKQILTKNNAPAIIYVNSRRKTKEIAAILIKWGFASSFYHGGLTHQEKQIAFTNWMQEKTPIMVATNAFGMGIDKENVKTVIHFETPNSIENYIQEAGRAGRNLEKSYSLILYNENDLIESNTRISNYLADVTFTKEIYYKLNQYFKIPINTLAEATFEFDLKEFCNVYQFPFVKTYNAIKILNRENILLIDEKIDKKATITFKQTSYHVLAYCERNKTYKKLIQLVLRTYGGVFENKVAINEKLLAKQLNTTSTEVVHQLKKIESDGIIAYNYSSSLPKITFLEPREDTKTINRISKNIKQQNQLKKDKNQQLLRYISNTKECRTVQLLNYFDEKSSKKCGSCDVCLSNKKEDKPLAVLISEIDTILKEKIALSSKEICILINESEQNILATLKIMLEKELIALNSHQKFTRK